MLNVDWNSEDAFFFGRIRWWEIRGGVRCIFDGTLTRLTALSDCGNWFSQVHSMVSS